MSIRPVTCGAIAIALALGPLRSPADELPETLFEPASGLEFETPVAEQLIIRQVAPDSPAAAAGLRAGDIVLGIDKYHFLTAAQAEAYLVCHGADPVRVAILRDGAEQHLIYIDDDAGPDVGHVPQPRYGQAAGIGIRIAGSTPVVIVAVYAGSPADRAGLLPGDRLLAVNDIACPNVAAVTAAIAQHPEGDQVHLTIRRDGADQTIAVTPEEWSLAFDEPPHVLPGWEAHYRPFGCYDLRNEFALRDSAPARAMEDELKSLRDEVRTLRQELTETNSRLDQLRANFTEN